MPQKWVFFTIGVMAGVIGLLGFALLTQAQQATASPTVATQDSNAQAGIVVATGGSQQNLTDIVWVLYKRPAPKKAGDDTGTTDGVLNKEEVVTLACYQVANNARNIKFVDVRNISWDMDLIALQGDQKPTVADVIKALRDEAKKKKDK
jgi:hypothetical protein